ncbi:MAG: hypothetical protein CSB44_03680 [Gammaproteobacteria bacterium]|nr:MAG: hypothetical protein CSB44_03680 [Gammaproteobacteria bacterium]
MLQVSTRPFCDWVTCTQVHDRDVPEVFASVTSRCDAEGELEWETPGGVIHEGSHSTSVLVVSDGRRVTLSGNVGRFGRPDNVFGYGVEVVKEGANTILGAFGLPPFEDGERVERVRRGEGGDLHPEISYMGATISRLDMTRNFVTGSAENAGDFLYWLRSQKIGRGDTDSVGNTVYWNRHSRYARAKMYAKGAEIRAQMRRNVQRRGAEHQRYLAELADWCDQVGLVRFEVTMKQRNLTQTGLRYWARCTDESVESEYRKREEGLMTRCENFEDVRALPVRLQNVFHAYMRGENIAEQGMSRATFYRYRQQLLAVGVDIAKELNVTALRVRPRVIELTAAEPPSFYRADMAA